MAGRGRRLLAAGLDAVTYALAVAAAASAVSAAVSFAFGYGLVGVKYGLFYLGFGVFAVAIVASWPGSPWQSPDLSFDLLSFGDVEDDDEEPTVPWVETEPSETSGSPDETGFEAFVQRLPPARFLPAPPGTRLPTGVKLFLAAVAVHGASFALEAVLGVPG